MPNTKDPRTNKPRRILIVDDNDIFRGALKTCVENAGYEAVVAENGRVAQEIVGVGGFHAIVSDIRMTPVNGIELLHFVRKNLPEVPVVLMTGFSELLETQEAHNLGAAGFLSKPFHGDELINLLEMIFAPTESDAALSLDDLYCKLSIDDFVSGRDINFDIYIRLSESKYVKIANRGENIPVERIRGYKAKGLSHLYMTKEDFAKYVGFSVMLAGEVAKSPAIDRSRKLNFLKHTQEVILEKIFHDEIKEESFSYAKTALETTVSVLTDSGNVFDMLSILNSHADFLYAHSLGVAIYSVMLAKEMGWNTANIIFKISMGALLHDVGKKELDPELLKKARKDMTPDEIKVYESHSERGMEILSRNKTIPGDVLQIILQHHENCAGTGFPSRLSKTKIHPFAKLVAVANEFCNFVIENPDSTAMAPGEAILRMNTLYAGKLDPTFLSALARLFIFNHPHRKAGPA